MCGLDAWDGLPLGIKNALPPPTDPSSSTGKLLLYYAYVSKKDLTPLTREPTIASKIEDAIKKTPAIYNPTEKKHRKIDLQF